MSLLNYCGGYAELCNVLPSTCFCRFRSSRRSCNTSADASVALRSAWSFLTSASSCFTLFSCSFTVRSTVPISTASDLCVNWRACNLKDRNSSSYSYSTDRWEMTNFKQIQAFTKDWRDRYVRFGQREGTIMWCAARCKASDWSKGCVPFPKEQYDEHDYLLQLHGSVHIEVSPTDAVPCALYSAVPTISASTTGLEKNLQLAPQLCAHQVTLRMILNVSRTFNISTTIFNYIVKENKGKKYRSSRRKIASLDTFDPAQISYATFVKL